MSYNATPGFPWSSSTKSQNRKYEMSWTFCGGRITPSLQEPFLFIPILSFVFGLNLWNESFSLERCKWRQKSISQERNSRLVVPQRRRSEGTEEAYTSSVIQRHKHSTQRPWLPEKWASRGCNSTVALGLGSLQGKASCSSGTVTKQTQELTEIRVAWERSWMPKYVSVPKMSPSWHTTHIHTHTCAHNWHECRFLLNVRKISLTSGWSLNNMGRLRSSTSSEVTETPLGFSAVRLSHVILQPTICHDLPA